MELDNESYAEQLINLAKTCGLIKNEAKLRKTVQQMSRLKRSYDIKNFSILPLPDPNSVSCYYQRNSSGEF
jgi:hypothetical protein